IDVGVDPVRAGCEVRITRDALIEIAIAGDVVIDADDVGGGGAIGKPAELVFVESQPEEKTADRMMPVDLAAQQVEGEPAAGVVEVGLVLERRSAVGGAEVLGLNEPGFGSDSADPLHCEHRSACLIEYRFGEG